MERSTSIEPPFQREMRGIITTAIDENIDALEDTIIDLKITPPNIVFNAIDSYATFISSILDNKISDLMNCHLGSEDNTPITSNINIDPIIDEIKTIMNSSAKPKVSKSHNYSITNKINDLMLNDLKETEHLFGELQKHF